MLVDFLFVLTLSTLLTSLALWSSGSMGLSRAKSERLLRLTGALLLGVLPPLLVARTPGYLPRSLLLLGMYFLWSLRESAQAFYLFHRDAVSSDKDAVSSDKDAVSSESGRATIALTLARHALASTLLLVPILLTTRNLDPFLGIAEIAGCLFWAAGYIGTLLAGLLFRQFPTMRPFFESLLWVGVGIYALPASALSLAAPAVRLRQLFSDRTRGRRNEGSPAAAKS